MKERMKAIIETLRITPHTKKDLEGILKIRFPSETQEALRKGCERSLKKLQELGLVNECDGYFRWYRYDDDFSGREDAGAKLLHSQKLIPALRRLAGIYAGHYQVGQQAKFESQEDALIQDKSAEIHIVAYPDVGALYDDFRKLVEKAEDEKKAFNTRLTQKLDTKFKQKLIQSSRNVRPKSYVKDNVPSLIHAQILRNCQSVSFEIKEDGEVWLEGILIAKGKRLSSQVKKFIEEEIKNEPNIEAVYGILKLEKEASEIQLRLQQEVRKLIMRVESGEPLLGGCDTCPKLYIRARPRQDSSSENRKAK